MSELHEPIIEETSQINSVTTSPAHKYLEDISNLVGSDTCGATINTDWIQEQIKSTESTANLHMPIVDSDFNVGGTVEREIEPVTIMDLPDKSVTNNKYDPELKEYMDSAFNTLTSLVNGIIVGPENWVLLLTKAMYVVSLIKTLDTDKKIRLSVDLVIRYLDDYTTLEDSILVGIKSSVHSMCVTILNNSGTLTHNVTKPAVITGDPDVLATPLQITDLVIKKLINLVKSREINVQGIKTIFPELVVLCITTVEKYPHFTGLEKKNLVIQIIQRFMAEYIPLAFTVSHDEKQGLAVLSQSLPFLVDTLVNVGRGKVNYKFNFSNPETLSKLKLFGLCLLSCIKRRPGSLEI